MQVAGELGFEPRQTESESVVLPLHHSPLLFNIFNRLKAIIAVLAADRATPAQAWRRSTRYLPPLASAGEKASCRGSGEAAAIGSAGGRAGVERMSVYFEELDFRPTAIGVLSLRRRRHLAS